MDRLDETIKKITEFRDERDWKQFHNPKDLAVSLSIEVSELLEIFQWKTNEEIEDLLKTGKRKRVEEEIADIGNYLLILCDNMGIDLIESINTRIKLNAEKYPVDKFAGSARKYNEE